MQIDQMRTRQATFPYSRAIWAGKTGVSMGSGSKGSAHRFWVRPLVMCAVLGGLVAGAKAADMPVYDDFVTPNLPSAGSVWEGGYVGAEAGLSQTLTESKVPGAKSTASKMDAAFGLFGGYNWQVSRVVLGVEAGATYLGGQAKKNLSGVGQVKAGSQWSASLRGRVGLPFESFMPYLTAGLAATDHSTKANGKTHSALGVGLMFGGGLEVAVSENWRVRADYSMTGILNEKDMFGGTRIERTAANHRLMLGVSYAF
ncbi:putative outer membrane protein [Roseibium sp. TrichSKD4]|uniref:outer membrane protein n=1 Tax=Roseibium sp. TrichSKD4 TaxID=744980 RepID=UPI0001E571D0|nr:outer membrane beta-barrel protein [Roseibium sp. TrichSKD4]EFO29017.1 putative outer membrane protein [Roseibium sp. TrichSKD4]